MQALAGLFIHSSSQKPHFEQPLTIRPKARTLATMVGALVLARAVDDEALSREILRDARDGLRTEPRG